MAKKNGDEKYTRVLGEMVGAANEVLGLAKESEEWDAEVNDFLKVLAKEQEVSIRINDALDILYSHSAYLGHQIKLNEGIQNDLIDYVDIVEANISRGLKRMKSKNFYVLRVTNERHMTDYGRTKGHFLVRVVVMIPLAVGDLRAVIAEFEDDVYEDWTTNIGFLEAGDEQYNPSGIKFEEWTKKDRKEAKRFHYETAWEEAATTIATDISDNWAQGGDNEWRYGGWFLEDTWEFSEQFIDEATHRLNTILSFFGLQEGRVDPTRHEFLGLLIHNPYNGVTLEDRLEQGWDSTGLIAAAYPRRGPTLEHPKMEDIKAAVKASEWSAKEATEGTTSHAGGQFHRWKDKPERVEKPWFILSLIDFDVSL